MKKIICTLISFAILILSISISFPVFAQEIEMKQIENFSENGVELVRKYDEGKDFEAVDEETDELDDLQFQTARLFVKCSSNFNKMGAERKVSGFEDWHILQFGSPEEAKKAYLYYKEQEKIEAVEPDVVLKVELEGADIFSEYDENANTDISPAAAKDPVYVTREEFDNDYSKRILGTNEVLNYINENNIQTAGITVGVIDSGIDYTHEIFESRWIKTNFNSTDSGVQGDEIDLDPESHGTSVASCIVSTTPDSVKVAVYKATAKGGDFDTKVSWILMALIKAYADKCDIINMSLGFGPLNEVLEDTLKKMKEDGITIFAASGNDNGLIPYGNLTGFLCQNENVIAVGASDRYNRRANFSNGGYFIAFLAPGKDVALAAPDNKYMLNSGTSFSCPFAVGIFATLKSLNSGFSNEKIIDLMKYTCADVFHAFYHDEVWHGTEQYGAGILDAWRAFCEMQKIPLVPDVEFSMPTGECNVGDKLILSCEEDYEIYYTTDLTVADKELGIKYTEPITITEDTVVNAIAYDKNGNRGQNKFEYYIAFETGEENDFVIDDNGIIIGYKGEIRNLEIPETINGKTVTGFYKDLFSGDCECEDIIPAKNTLTALRLPKTVEYLEEDTWLPDLESFSAVGLKEIPDFGFTPEGKTLTYINIPNVEKVGLQGFWGNCGIYELYLPNCTEIGDMALYGTLPYHLYLPKLQYFHHDFLYQTSVTDLYCPELISGIAKENGRAIFSHNVSFLFQMFLPTLKSIDYNGLAVESLRRAEFSEIESLMQLPIGIFENECSLVLPLSLKEIDFGNQYKNQKTYKFYGTKGSYAEQWANENSIEFIELNQETAVYTDVRETCNEYTETLFFDSLGFHKSYQWYGSFDNSTNNGVAIEGADKELINLKDYREYPYYYCVCTSTDIGENTEHVEKIYSKVCRNTDYQSADYSAYNAAVKYADSLDKSLYKDFSKVDEALRIDVANLPLSLQNKVDEATKAILDAIEKLEYKPADYTAYNAAVEKANALDRSLYKDLTALDEALNVDVSGKNITEQAIVDKQTKAIEEALMALEFKNADYSAYNAAVEKANALDKSLYADTTELDKLLAADISGLTILNQDIVDEQTKAIEDALKNLVFKPADYAEVEKAKAQIPEDLSVYTDGSVSALQEVLNSVDYSLNITQQATVDGYAQAIIDAVNALELKPVEPPVTEEPTKPDATKPGVSEGTTKPSVPEESTTLPDSQKTDIPNTGGVVPVSYTVALLTLLYACIYIGTDSKRKNKK